MSANLDKEPVSTNNTLADIVTWLGEGDCIILHAPHADVAIERATYHNKCAENKEGKLVNKTRFIFVDLSSVVQQSNWPWHIMDARCKPCKCACKDVQSNSQHKYIHHIRMSGAK